MQSLFPGYSRLLKRRQYTIDWEVTIHPTDLILDSAIILIENEARVNELPEPQLKRTNTSRKPQEGSS